MSPIPLTVLGAWILIYYLYLTQKPGGLSESLLDLVHVSYPQCLTRCRVMFVKLKWLPDFTVEASWLMHRIRFNFRHLQFFIEYKITNISCLPWEHRKTVVMMYYSFNEHTKCFHLNYYADKYSGIINILSTFILGPDKNPIYQMRLLEIKAKQK